MVRAILLILLFGTAPSGRAQSASTGGLSGTVADPSGSGIPNVTISLTQSATRQTQTATTGENGSFGFSLLSPGAYEVEFPAPGFKTARLSPVAVNVSEVPALDAVLEAGESAEPVACQCRLSVDDLVHQHAGRCQDHHRGPADHPQFHAGALHGLRFRRRRQQCRHAGPRHAQRQRQRQYQRRSLHAGRGLRPQRGAQSRHHFGIEDPDFAVRRGVRRQVPSTALITKSGENEFHGDAWEFVRNDVLQRQLLLPQFHRAVQAEPQAEPVRRHAGRPGPRGKLFFFGSYQGTRQVNGLDTTSTSNPILPPLTSDRSAAALAAQFCPANHPRRRPVPDLRRRKTARLPQPDHGPPPRPSIRSRSRSCR